MKKNRIIILTTHAMEEADVLSDRIAVIVDGQFECVGTPLYLKNTFGDGYRINMICEQDDSKEVISLVQKLIPSAKLLEEAGGSVVFGVPITKIKEITPILKLLQSDTNRDSF